MATSLISGASTRRALDKCSCTMNRGELVCGTSGSGGGIAEIDNFNLTTRVGVFREISFKTSDTIQDLFSL